VATVRPKVSDDRSGTDAPRRSWRFRLDSHADAVRAALIDMRKQLHGRTRVDLDIVELVLAEVLTNVVRHACQGEAGHPIDLKLRHQPVGLFVLVCDQGLPMPGHAAPEGRPADPEALPEGGFGWSLIRMLASDIRYVRRRGRNRIALRFTPQEA
jgi:serine/threonine-protein kinase RsbW